MPREIHCPKCGARTPITSLFCVECGEKIEFSKIKPEHFQESDNKALKLVGNLARLFLTLAIFGGAALSLWPAAPVGQVGDEVQAREGRMKIVRLHDAARNGLRIRAELSEPELNAYLEGIVRQNRESQDGRTPANLEGVRLGLAENQVELHALIRLKVIRITYLLRGTPGAGESGFTYDVQQARLGHLPMPGPLRNWVAGRMVGILGGLEAERLILQRLESIQVIEQRLRVATRQG